jgi:hypothetical protein
VADTQLFGNVLLFFPVGPRKNDAGAKAITLRGCGGTNPPMKLLPLSGIQSDLKYWSSHDGHHTETARFVNLF